MNGSDERWNNPFWLLAGLVGLGFVIAGVLWGLSYLLPSLGAAFGYLAAGAIHGAVSGAVAGWFSSVALYAGGTMLVGGGITVSIRVVKEAAKKPFYAAVVILAACQTFLIDMVKELWSGDNVTKWLFKASTALLFAIAAALWAKGGWRFRVSGVAVFIVMPVMVLLLAVAPYLNRGLRDAIDSVPSSVWCAIAGFVCFATSAVFLGRFLKTADDGSDV
jgi:hypothetical protein